MMNQATARQVDRNGYITIAKNPISKVGVFQYSGARLPEGDPNRLYGVLRPEEELNNPDTLASFCLLPLTDDHPEAMLGEGYGLAVEDKGSHGTTGENVVYEDGIVYSSLRIFSETLKNLIDQGKKELSLGFRCIYEKASGVYNGQPYEYIQRKIRGNHLSLVLNGRCGSEVSVLDSYAFDSFELDLTTTGENNMADEDKKPEDGAGTSEEQEMSLAEACAMLKKLVPQVQALQSALAGEAEDDMGGGDEPGDDTALDEEKDDESKEDKKDEKKEDAMDAAEVKKRFAKLETQIKDASKNALKEVSQRNALALQVSQEVGTFDASEMTLDEVTKYALDKFEIKAPKGTEHAVLSAYLQGKKAAGSSIGFAMDSVSPRKKDGKLNARLNKQA